MATNNVNLGIGNALGMAYIAPVGTSLPASALDTPGASWASIGDVTADGITWSTGKDSDPLRNWAKQTVRLVGAEEGGTLTVPLMNTTKKTLETIFGEDNVSFSAATSSNGNITSVTVEPGVSASPMAFYFRMKDGDDAIGIGSTHAIVREVSDVTFAPTEAITWEVTIESASWTFTKDDGQVTS